MLLKIFIFIIGSLVGSFLNVCIYRLPRGESIVFPPSHCVHCNRRIAWYDNIPFLSYMALRARCRFCNRSISFRYFLVEFLMALLLLILFVNFGLSVKFFFLALLMGALIISMFIDFEHLLIPDIITIPGIFIGLIASFLFPSILGETIRLNALLNSLGGIIVGGGSIYATGVLGKLLFRKKIKSLGLEEAMGGGDVTLMAMIGAFLGWKLAVLIFLLAPFLGFPIGIILKIKEKRDVIPYAPYISIAAVIATIWGEKILNYLFFYFY